LCLPQLLKKKTKTEKKKVTSDAEKGEKGIRGKHHFFADEFVFSPFLGGSQTYTHGQACTLKQS
jgi:hypothetical protein